MDKSEFKASRKAKSMTQKELSHFLGATLSAVQKWESGQNKIPKWVIEKLNRGSSFVVTGLSGAEIAEMERRAQKGQTPDEYVANLIRGFIKLSIFIAIPFLLFHLMRTPNPKWTAAALKQTVKVACLKAKTLLPK